MNNTEQLRQAVKKSNEYNEMSSFRKGEWDKNKRHLCQLWRDYNG